MEDIFKPESQTILKLFSNTDSRYQIPDYQRPYSWSDDEIEQLWEDLKDAFENNQQDRGADVNYFLGSIITVPGEKGYQDVIDGQQRITTLMILFCVVRDLFPNINDEIDPDTVPDVIKISNIKRCISDDNERKRLKFHTAPAHQNDFESVIVNGKPTELKKPSQRDIKTSPKCRFQNAAFIFTEKLRALANSDPQYIGKFVNYIFNSGKIIKITCTSRAFAIKLFQSLNATGLDLTPTDLLKSFFMSRLSDDRSKQFVSDWTKVEAISSEIDFKDLNELFVSYEYYRLGSNPKRSLNDELEELFRDEDPNRAICDIRRFAEVYRSDVFGSEKKSIYSLRYLRWALYWKTIVCAAIKEEYQDLDGLLFELRRFYYLYWIAGKTLTQIKQTSFNLLKWVKEKRPLSEIKADLRKKTEEDKIIDRVKENLSSAIYNEPWCKPLLLLIEYAQTGDSVSPFIEMTANLHVEHIIPLEYSKFSEWKHVDDSFFEKFGHSIGNLTLLSGTKNIEASNNPFHVKLDVYKGLGKDKTKRAGITSFEITKKIVADVSGRGATPNWFADDTKSRWNWICGEVSVLLDVDLTTVQI